MPSAMPSRTTGKAQITSRMREITASVPAAVVAGEQAEDGRQQGGDQRRGEADRTSRCARRTSAAPSRRGRGCRRRRGRTCRRRRTRPGRSAVPSTLTTSRFSPSTSSFSVVWVAFGPVWATWFGPQRRRQHEGARSAMNRAERGERDAVARAVACRRGTRDLRCAAAPRWAPAHALIVARSLGRLLELEAGQVLAEGRVEDHLFEVDRRWRRRSRRCDSRTGPRAPVPCIPCPSAAYSASCSGPSGSSPSLAILSLSFGCRFRTRLVLLVGQDAFPRQQRLEEVVRVRVVLEPVEPAGVEVGRRSGCRSP